MRTYPLHRYQQKFVALLAPLQKALVRAATGVGVRPAMAAAMGAHGGRWLVVAPKVLHAAVFQDIAYHAPNVEAKIVSPEWLRKHWIELEHTAYDGMVVDLVPRGRKTSAAIRHLIQCKPRVWVRSTGYTFGINVSGPEPLVDNEFVFINFHPSVTDLRS